MQMLKKSNGSCMDENNLCLNGSRNDEIMPTDIEAGRPHDEPIDYGQRVKLNSWWQR